MNEAKRSESAASACWAEPGEELRAEFEREYGRDRKRKDANGQDYGQDYGQWLDLHRLPPNDKGYRPYRSMVTACAWMAFRHGRGVMTPNTRS